MRIKTVTCFYNEEFLVPFYLKHYAFADRIHALVTPGTDRTEELLRADPRVVIEHYESPEGINDRLKCEKINAALNSDDSKNFDWLLAPDADEFIWPKNDDTFGTITKSRLAAVHSDFKVIAAAMWQVYRHKTDSDLDASKPVAAQRRHGIAERHSPGLSGYIKPIVIRANCGVRMQVGNHSLEKHYGPVPELFDGAHWAMADPSFALNRIIRDRRDRMSPENLRNGHGIHRTRTTPEEVLAICKAREDDPQIF